MAYDHGAFRVRKLDDAIRFYVDKLGFKLLFQETAEQFGERYAFLEYNGARLELIETLTADYQPQRPERPYCPHLCFETEDMDQVIHMLEENGIEIINGPNEIPGSERWLYFLDSDMNVLEYIIWLDKDKK